MTLTTPQQPDLFAAVLETYLEHDGPIDNATLYRRVAAKAGLPPEALTERTPIGVAGVPRSQLTRTIRWHQQTLRAMGMLTRTGARGIWELAERTPRGLHEARPGVQLVAFSTRLGLAVWGNCQSVLAGLDQPITLCLTSPPFLLARPRAYGNPLDEGEYVDFLCRALEPVVAHLAPGGSIVLNLPNDVFERGLPARSLYCERLLLTLRERFGLFLMDRLVWRNGSRPPGPMQWASRTRQQLNGKFDFLFWLTNNPSRCRADNRRVLEAHTARHLALIQGGGEQRSTSYGDGAYRLRPGAYGQPTPGRIPGNVIDAGHRCADTQRYRADAAALGLPTHGAVMPLSIPDFLIRLLTEKDELVVDPFGGTVKTGMAAERLGRRWLVVEKVLDYLRASAERFRGFDQFHMPRAVAQWPRAA